MADYSTPFAQQRAFVDSGNDAPTAPTPSPLPTFDSSFDDILPTSPSIDNFLNHATTGLRQNGRHDSNPMRLNSNVPNRLFTLSNGRSLEMGSLDLSWLDSGNLPPQVAPSHHGGAPGSGMMQRQPSAAEVLMGPEPKFESDLPSPPALRMGIGQSNITIAGQNAAHQGQGRQFASPSPMQSSAAPVTTHFGHQSFNNNAATPSRQQRRIPQRQQRHQHGVPPESTQQLWQQQQYQQPPAQPGFVPITPQPVPQPSHNNNITSPAVSTGATTASFLLPSLYPGLPPHPSMSNAGNTLSGRADAMTQWAHERALMQALSSSDAAAAVEAMAACGVDQQQQLQAGAAAHQSCPFQLQMSRQPALVCVAPSSRPPVRLSTTPPSPGSQDQ